MRQLAIATIILSAVPGSMMRPEAPLSPPVVKVTYLGSFKVTAYRPLASQTDDSPTWTSIGDRTTMFGVAVSQDLICKVSKHCRRNVFLCDKRAVHYGDILYIPGIGRRVVNDVMNARYKQHIDLLVFTKNDEAFIDRKYRNKQVPVYLLGD